MWVCVCCMCLCALSPRPLGLLGVWCLDTHTYTHTHTHQRRRGSGEKSDHICARASPRPASACGTRSVPKTPDTTPLYQRMTNAYIRIRTYVSASYHLYTRIHIRIISPEYTHAYAYNVSSVYVYTYIRIYVYTYIRIICIYLHTEPSSVRCKPVPQERRKPVPLCPKYAANQCP